MADQNTQSLGPDSDYPAVNFPTVFADGVISVANSAHVVKFYLARNEPSFSATHSGRVQAFAQVVMPVDGFISTVTFFQRMLSKLIRDGIITEDQVDAVNALNVTPEAK